jgi:hypothetical protein
MKNTNTNTLEENLVALLETASKAPCLSVEEILSLLSEKGRLLILVFLSIPFCQPLSIPGLSVLFGLLITIIGFRMMLGKSIRLPGFIKKKTIPSQTLKKSIHRLLKILKKLRKYIHPRLYKLCRRGVMKRVHGGAIFLLGIFLSLPIPVPISNMLAGWAVFLLGTGLLEKDGLLIIFGYTASIVMLGVTIVLFEFLRSIF